MVNEVSRKNSDTAIIINGQIFSYLDSGFTRDVFVNEEKTVVVKLEKEKGYNKEELEVYENTKDKSRLAKTWVENGYLFQEYLDKDWHSKVPLNEFIWAGKCRNEVGLDKDGNLKCYDLSEYMRY